MLMKKKYKILIRSTERKIMLILAEKKINLPHLRTAEVKERLLAHKTKRFH